MEGSKPQICVRYVVEFCCVFSQLTTLGINRVIHKVFPTGAIRRVLETGDKMKSQDENSREVKKREMRNQTSFIT
jgi:hypothetical protein